MLHLSQEEKAFRTLSIHPEIIPNRSQALFFALTYPGLIKLLLDNGAEAASNNNRDGTLLHNIANLLHHIQVDNLLISAELLAAAGAKPDAINAVGRTPIDLFNYQQSVRLKAGMPLDPINLKKFQQVTEHPRPLNEILSPSQEDSFPANFQLSETDRTNIECYNEKKFSLLIASGSSNQTIQSFFNKHKNGNHTPDEQLTVLAKRLADDTFVHYPSNHSNPIPLQQFNRPMEWR